MRGPEEKRMACTDLGIRSPARAYQRRVRWIVCSTLIATVAALAPAPVWGPSRASAQEAASSSAESGGIKDSSPQSRPMMLSFFTGLHLGHFAGYGFPLLIGGRFYIPLVHDGFIPSLNDEFGIEFGLDFDITFLSSIYNESVLFGFGIPADAMWAFHFSAKFDAYAKLGFVLGSAF